jgi:hypothetical protein
MLTSGRSFLMLHVEKRLKEDPHQNQKRADLEQEPHQEKNVVEREEL